VSTAATTGLDIRPLAVGIAVSASVDFLTPIGYQTNTMVYGPGGYRFFDYARLGAPLTLMALLLIVLIVPLAWPL
jgi:di/tricarboxylate transporter